MLTEAREVKRTNRFYQEARLPSAERATLQDYKNSGFDRGHLFPAGDASSDKIMAQSFSLSNIVPQAAQHNRRAWNIIERDTAPLCDACGWGRVCGHGCDFFRPARNDRK